MKRTFNILLFCALLLLLYLCIRSIGGTVAFNQEREKREKEIEKQFVLVARWQTAFRDSTGNYTASWDTLAAFAGGHGLEADVLARFGRMSFSSKLMTLNLQDTILGGTPVKVYRLTVPFEDYLEGLDTIQIAKLRQRALSEDEFPGKILQ